MKIAIVAWGSLVWNPGCLPFSGLWQQCDLKLPIEFSRKSSDGRLTLVVDFEHGCESPMYIALSARTELSDAVADLRDREQTIIARIGWYDKNKSRKKTSEARTTDSELEKSLHTKVAKRVAKWIKSTDYDAAIWTALASNYLKEMKSNFSIDHAMNYLSKLGDKEKRLAFDYIHRAPDLIKTKLREKFENQHPKNGG